MTFWVNGTFFCCGVGTNDEGIITEAAPILYRFIGQHIDRLRAWDKVIEIRSIG